MFAFNAEISIQIQHVLHKDITHFMRGESQQITEIDDFANANPPLHGRSQRFGLAEREANIPQLTMFSPKTQVLILVHIYGYLVHAHLCIVVKNFRNGKRYISKK